MANLTIADIKQKYPEYNKFSDQELADKLYNKFYSGKIPKDEYYNKIGLTTKTFLGNLPTHADQFQFGSPENKSLISEMMGSALGGGTMELAGKGISSASPYVAKAVNYLRPSEVSKAAEEFRSGLGSGTSTENIDELAKRVQLGKQSAIEEALIPKRPLYEQEGKTNIYESVPDRKSAYFSPDVAEFYGKRGLKTLHDTFEQTPSLENYDKLQSALKEEIRYLKEQKQAKTLNTLGKEKLNSLEANVENLDSDKEAFMQTLPENMRNLENNFRYKYASNVGPYEEAGEVIRNLSNPDKVSEVSPAQITKVFGRPSKDVKKVLQDIGPSGARNILYNALLKAPEGDAEGMANTLLDLKRTKGFDNIVSSDMEQWAKKILKRSKYSNVASRAVKTAAGGVGGYLLGGNYLGALGGAALVNSPKILEYISKYAKK